MAGSKPRAEWKKDIMKENPFRSVSMKEQVQAVIDQIRPILQADGGDIQLIGVDEKTGIVTVGLRGRCGGCPAAQMTLKAVVERKIKEVVPGVTAVERV